MYISLFPIPYRLAAAAVVRAKTFNCNFYSRNMLYHFQAFHVIQAIYTCMYYIAAKSITIWQKHSFVKRAVEINRLIF